MEAWADDLLRGQCQRYPRLEAQDLVKALYQEEFGCGHLVSAAGEGLAWLEAELQGAAAAPRDSEPPLVEPLGGRFCRVHLSAMEEAGLSPKTLFGLFARSGAESTGDMGRFSQALARLEELAKAGELPVQPNATSVFLAEYRAAGCPAIHHSEEFRRAYAPAYRVIRAGYGALLPLLCAVDKLLAGRQNPILVAIDGGSASGKTTLAALLGELYGANVFHMDDFFLQPHQRTPERYAQPGGNVDRERFRQEVLEPLCQGRAFAYRRFDCGTMALGEAVSVRPTRLNIVEGAYSMHPELAGAYALSAFLSVDACTQAQRILRRNGPAMQARFLKEWIPLEERYFHATDAAARCSMILHGEECAL